MDSSHVNLSALIGSRICHDLISPIGAINNGLELLGMSGDQSGPEMDLIQESVGNASARIRYFRVAFGAAGEQTMGRSEITSILGDVVSGARLDVAWGPMDAQPRSEVRLAFLALLCVETACPMEDGSRSASRMGAGCYMAMQKSSTSTRRSGTCSRPVRRRLICARRKSNSHYCR